MPWTEQWSIKVDSHEVNDLKIGGHYVCVVPEAQSVPEQTVLLVERDRLYPVVVGLQPKEGIWTFMISVKHCDWAGWETRRAELASWFSLGAHTFTFQIRGMPTAKTVSGIVRGIAFSPLERRATVQVTVPNPTLV